MGQYFNMIRELIYQSELNGTLLNDINNYFSDNEAEPTGIKEHHLNRVNEKYLHEVQPPIYNYFDGTQLINSLFSTIVVPIEFIKGRYFNHGAYNPYRTIDELLQQVDFVSYQNCENQIHNLKMDGKIINTYTDRINVYDFFTHIRDALCHSGNGQLHFFPDDNNQQNISDIYFFDEIGNENAPRYKCFFAKLNIQRDLIPLVNHFDHIVINLANDNTRPYSIEDISNKVWQMTGRTIR